MGKLTIQLRIALSMAVIAVAFATFTSAFFPQQASKMGNQLLTHSAVTIASLFAENIEPAFDTLGFGGEEIVQTALEHLSSGRSFGPALHANSVQPFVPIAINRASVYDEAGRRLDGYNDAPLPLNPLRPVRELLIEDEGSGALRIAAPVYSSGSYRGFFTIEFSKQHLNRLVGSNLRTALAVSTLTCLVLVALGALIGRSISAPIRRVAEAMRSLEEGDGDLTFRLGVEGDDEIGQLASRFNAFVSKLQRIIREVAGRSETLGEAAAQLTGISDRMVQNSQTVTSRATAVAQRTLEVSHNVDAVAGAAHQATQNVESVSHSTGQMSRNMSQVSRAAEAVLSNAVEVERSMQTISDGMKEIRGSTEKAAAISREGSDRASPVQEVLAQLTTSADATGKILQLIGKVADQTNLLSLNASIEAASAGEAGKGFGVVANEVKELARETTAATKKIEAQIGDMQRFTRESVAAIAEIIELMNSAHSINAAIAGDVEDQAVVATRVFGSSSDSTRMINDVTSHISEASGMASSVASSSSELASGISAISTNAHEASEAAREVSAHIESVRMSAVDSSNNATQVRVRAQELADLAGKLKALVGQFRI